MDDPKSGRPHPELSVRADPERREERGPEGGLPEPAPEPFTPARRARAERLIATRGLHAARALDPSLAGRCIECWAPVEGSRAFCSDACITARVQRNREQVSAIAREGGPRKPGT